jgi:hypothetical protein
VRKFVGLVSSLVYLMGCLVLVIGAVLAWASVVVSASMDWGWWAGAVIMLLSALAMRRWEPAVRRPWELWHALWLAIDNELEERMR